jgi:hypothetical protein
MSNCRRIIAKKGPAPEEAGRIAYEKKLSF